MATPPTRSPRAVLGCVFGPTVLAGDALMLLLSGGGGRSFFFDRPFLISARVFTDASQIDRRPALNEDRNFLLEFSEPHSRMIMNEWMDEDESPERSVV